MKAIQVQHYGGIDQLQCNEIPTPQPKATEALIKLHYAGVNFIDIYMRDGTYAKSQTYQTPLPMTLGMEAVGEIIAIGEKVTDFVTGETVCYCLVRGSYAQYAAVPTEKLTRVPSSLPLASACTLMLQGFTAHYLSHSAFLLNPNHTCLIHAAAGGVGQLLTQLAKQRGARVIATVGHEEKAALVKQLGADHCILYRHQNFADEVHRITETEGVDVVYDSIGKATLHRSLQCLKRRGYCINYGASSGQAPPIAPLQLAESGSVFLTRPHLADYIASPSERQQRADALFQAVNDKTLQVRIDRTIPLEDAARAHHLMETRQTRGKLLLQIPVDDPS